MMLMLPFEKALLGSLCGADGLISIDAGVAEIERGTSVRVRLI